MFYNLSGIPIIEEFEQKYMNSIFALYPHISNLIINFVTSEQYLELENVTPIDGLNNDSFAYSCNRLNNTFIGYIIFSPSICSDINLTQEEYHAALAHEVGHIVHYFNEALIGQPQLCQEIKADEVVVKIGLKESLISVLNKLIQSKFCTDSQCNDMLKRIMWLK